MKCLFVLLSVLLWPLCCLSFFDLRILIAPLVSSNSFYIIYHLGTVIHNIDLNTVEFRHEQKAKEETPRSLTLSLSLKLRRQTALLDYRNFIEV